MVFENSEASLATVGAAIVFSPAARAVVVIGGRESNGATLQGTVRTLELYQDTDAAASIMAFGQCAPVCGGVKEAPIMVTRSGSFRGLRHLNTFGVAQSVAGGHLGFTEAVCECPVCMYGPGSTSDRQGPADDPFPPNGRIPAYPSQVLADGSVVPLVCQFGEEDGLAPGQGYVAIDEFVCQTDATDSLRDHYGKFTIREDACKPLSCLPPPIPNLATITGCRGEVLHGTECVVTCEAGYGPTSPAFVCDRGVYLETITCERLECAGGVLFESQFELGECDYGYERTGADPFCIATSTGVEFEFEPPVCAPLPCGGRPKITNGKYSDTCPKAKEMTFGGTCPFDCNLGYVVSGSPSGTAVCDLADGVTFEDPETLVQWSAPTECEPVICVPDLADENFRYAITTGACFKKDIAYSGRCSMACLDQASPGGKRLNIGTKAEFECSDRDGVYGLLPRGGACKPVACSPPESVLPDATLSCIVDGVPVETSEDLPHGGICSFECPGGHGPAPRDAQAFTCDAGEVRGCADSECAVEICAAELHQLRRRVPGH
jgi:hypothetical protein